MKMRYAAIALALAVAVPARAQNPPVPARDLIQEVVANELADRVQQRKWIYVVEKRDGSQTLTEAQVETNDGPLYRVLAIDHRPLNAEQRQQDNARIDALVRDPSRQARFKRAQDEDERTLKNVMQLMADAFLYDYDGVDADFVHLRFRPKPSYDPPTYEARVLHSLAGTILVDSRQKRLAKMSGQVINRVEFGYGWFGHIDSGGTIEIGRTQVGPSQWKTAVINVRLSGRLVLFKTIDKQHYETRTGFRALPPDVTLSRAQQLLATGGGGPPDAK